MDWIEAEIVPACTFVDTQFPLGPQPPYVTILLDLFLKTSRVKTLSHVFINSNDSLSFALSRLTTSLKTGEKTATTVSHSNRTDVASETSMFHRRAGQFF